LSVKTYGAESQAFSAQWATKGGEFCTKLFANIGDHPVVGSGRASENWDRRTGKAVNDSSEPSVVGSKVVTPIRNAVHLVNHNQAGATAHKRHDLVTKFWVSETLRRDDDQVN
jgi:hypothetical protein